MQRRRKSTKFKLFSIIVPAYKQQKTITKDLKRIKRVLDQLRYKYELIVVVDGFLDKTYEKAKKVESSKVKIYGYEHNHGKGNAIRYGMAKSKGEIVAFIDAGMDLHPNGLSMLLEHFEWYDADIIVGSKLHPVSKVSYPIKRKVLSWGYRMLTGLLFGLNVKDTQVGMKIFRKKVLEDILPRLVVKRYAFDVEILAVSHHLGHRRIFEAPVELDFRNAVSSISSKSFWKIVTLMVIDTFAIFYRLKIRRYYDNKNKRRWRFEPELSFRINLP